MLAVPEAARDPAHEITTRLNEAMFRDMPLYTEIKRELYAFSKSFESGAYHEEIQEYVSDLLEIWDNQGTHRGKPY